MATLKKLNPYQPKFLVPKGMKQNLKKLDANHILEHTYGETSTIDVGKDQQLKITAVPAKHWSCTDHKDVNLALWSGWMVQCGTTTVYFAGDTGYDKNMFREIKKHFPKIDLAFLPIAPDGERDVHLNVEDALQVTQDLSLKRMVPIHWGAYRTGTERIEDPINELRALLKQPKWKTLVDVVDANLKVGKAWTMPAQAKKKKEKAA